MGIKKPSWKKIWKFWKVIVGTIFFIGAIITIATNWDFVLNRLSFLGNLFVRIFAPLSNPIVRNVLLLILIVGILVWLILIGYRKLKKLKFTEEQLFVLALIAESNEPASYRLLSGSYREKFPGTSVINFKSTISWLERNGFIRCAGGYENNLVYVATDKGIEYAEKESKRIEKYRKNIDAYKEMSEIVKKY